MDEHAARRRAIRVTVTRLARPDTTEASMSAVDRYGFEMIAVSPAGRAAVRLGFPEECTTGEQVRRAMVALVADARSAAAVAG